VTDEKNGTETAESARETEEIMADPDLMKEIALSRMEARAGMTVPWEDVRQPDGDIPAGESGRPRPARRR